MHDYRLPRSNITIDDLENLITEKIHEDELIDYKEAVPNRLPDTICSFLNANGGHIVIGVKEEKNVPVEIIGVERNTLSKISRYINNVSPCPQLKIMDIPFKDDLVVYVLFIPRNKGNWYLSKGKFTVRIGDSSFPLESEDEITKWKKNHQENQQPLDKEVEESKESIHYISFGKGDLVSLIDKSVDKELEKYCNQGELLKTRGMYQWPFSVKVIEKDKYKYEQTGGKPVRTYLKDTKKELVIIIGKRGSGKTVATIQLQQELLDRIPEEKDPVNPIRLELRKFSLVNDEIFYDGCSLDENHFTLVNIIKSWCVSSRKHVLTIKEQTPRETILLRPELLKNPKLLLILDGWDELTHDLNDEFENFLKIVTGQVPVVITTRRIPKPFSLPGDAKMNQLITCLPPDDDILAYFKYRWAYFGYRVKEDHIQNLKKLTARFRSPFEMHALSLLPPDSTVPQNTAALYRRMVYCTILWEHVKDQKRKDISSFRDYEDILEYLNRSILKSELGKTLMETILGSDQEDPLLSVIGKIAYDAYWKDLPNHYYHEVIKLNPFTKYFVDRLLDTKSSRFVAVLVDYHLYPYFAAEYILAKLLVGNKLDIPIGEVLDLFEELLDIDHGWKRIELGNTCTEPQDVIFEFFAEDKIKGQRELKANFSGETFLEHYRLSMGVPEYAKIMREELLSHYRIIKEDNSRKKLLRSLLKELIFNPPQHYFSWGYDTVIKGMSEDTGVTKYPSEYKKVIYEIHGLEDEDRYLKKNEDTRLLTLVDETPYYFTFHWLSAYLDGQITPLIAKTLWKRLKTKNDGKKINKAITTILLQIQYKPAVDEFLTENLLVSNTSVFDEQFKLRIRSPLQMNVTELSDESKSWLREHADPRQIDIRWNDLVINDYSIPSIRIRLSQGEYSANLIKKSKALLMNTVNSKESLESKSYFSSVLTEHKTPFDDLFGSLLQATLIKSENKATTLFKDTFINAISEWKVYLIKLVKRWYLHWLEDDLIDILEEVKNNDVIIEIVHVLCIFKSEQAIHYLRKLWDEGKITEQECLHILHTLTNLEEWPWKEFITKSSIESWAENHQIRWNDHYMVFSDRLKIFFEHAEDEMVKKIASILNGESTKPTSNLSSLTMKLVPFSCYNLTRMEKLFDIIDQKVKNQLFRDLLNVYFDIEWKTTFIGNHIFEIEDLTVLSRAIRKDVLPKEHKKQLIKKLITIHADSLELDKEGELKNAHGLDAIIEEYIELEDLDLEDIKFLEELWLKLPGDKLSLPALTRLLLLKKVNQVIDALIDKLTSERDIDNICSLMKQIPGEIQLDDFWKRVSGVLPSSSDIYQILEENPRSLNWYFRELSDVSHPAIIEYTTWIWKECPDELLFNLLGVIENSLFKSATIPQEFILERFNNLPIRIVWQQLEQWSVDGGYSLPINNQLFAKLLLVKYDDIKASFMTSSRKEAIGNLLGRINREDVIVSLGQVYALVKNPPESRSQWENKWVNTLHVHSKLNVDEVWDVITSSKNDSEQFSRNNLEYLLIKYRREINNTHIDEQRKESIRKFLKRVWGKEKQEKLDDIYQLVKYPPEKQEYWEQRWNKDEDHEKDIEPEGFDYYDPDSYYERLDRFVEEGRSLLGESNKKLAEYYDKLFSLDNDDFHTVITSLASSGRPLLALNIGYKRIKLLNESCQGFHGDGTGYLDYQAPFASLRKIIISVIESGDKIPFDKDGIILEELLHAIINISNQRSNSDKVLYENTYNDLIELNEDQIFQVLSDIPLEILYPHIILNGYEDFFETWGTNPYKHQWIFTIYNFLVDELRS